MHTTRLHQQIASVVLLFTFSTSPLFAGFPGGALPPGLTEVVRSNTAAINQSIASQALSADYGYRPLHAAAHNNNMQMVKHLLQKGVAINSRTSKGQTALHIAAKQGYIDLLQLLLKSGVQRTARDKNNNTALDLATATGQMEVVRMLTATSSKNTPQPIESLHDAAKAGNMVALKKHLNNNNINQGIGEYQWTALHMAATNDNPETVQLLLKEGADFTAVEQEYQRTALHIAAMLGHLGAVKQLSQADIINQTDSQHETALHMACYRGHTTVVKALLTAGADINATTAFGDNPLSLAVFAGHKDIAKLLLTQGADIGDANHNMLYDAVRHGDKQLVAVLIKKGFPQLNSIDEDGEAALHLAAASGNADVISVLLNGGADIDLRTDDILGGQTALHIAALRGHHTVVQQLLQHG